MQPGYSPEDHLTAITQHWIGSVLIMGAVLFPVLEFMDYFASPGNFTRFMIYRLTISAILLIFYYLNKLKTSRPYQYLIAAFATVLCAVTIELAVLRSGGQSSVYYAAMMILMTCALGFAPVGMPLAIIMVSVIYGIYVVPIVLTEPVTSGVFVSNNAFLIAAAAIALLLRYHNQKLIVSELHLRAELSEDKRTLEQYSTRLEDLVAAKTGELAVSEEKYRALFENATDGIVLLDRKGFVKDVNSRFCEIHLQERMSILGSSYRLFEADSRAGEPETRYSRILNGETLVYETEHFRKDGGRVSLEVSARAIEIGGVPHMQLFHRDIMEKKKLQEQLLQSQKMESVGVLAGGIAHDFNNVLTAILGHAEVLRRRVRDDEFARRTIKIIEDAGIRAGQMVSKLLSFARKENFALSPTDLNAVVSDTVELLQHALMSRAIRVGMSTAPGLPAVMGDAVHLGQVIANLVMNSMDAMPEGGSITVSTSVETLGDEAPHVHPLLAPGTYAVLTVADTGAGIPREIMDRIFDPFFTTKPAGKGTGLGLAMVYGIVKSHGGEIRVESRMGEGARFSLYFPVAPQLAWSFTPGRADDAAPAGGAGILVVDDDKDVLTAVKDILEPRGYRVIVTDSPVHAHDLFSRISENIDLVITDMMMPHINGGDLARQLKDFRHTVKVIGISGLDPAALFRQTQEIDRFLRKPFDSSALLSAVREVLHATQ